MSDAPRKGILGPILIAAVVTLLVNLTRLYGELQGWSPAVFNTDAGGGGSPLGITWLVLPLGFWFGRRLAQAGKRPVATGRALLLLVTGMALMVGTFALVMGTGLIEGTRQRSIAVGVAALLISLLALKAWPAAWAANVAYGVLARVPVMVIQFFAVERGWDTHFSKGPPESDRDAILFLLTMAQATFWPFAFTALVGGVCATLGAATVRK